jgi:RNA polymerase sigma factor (sigma-70 family)
MNSSPLQQIVHHARRLAGRSVESDITDAALLERFIAGSEEAAFTLLVHRHGPMVLGVCRRLLRSHQDAEDAFQATFLVLLRKASSIRTHAVLGSWLHRVAYRTASRMRAQRARLTLVDIDNELPSTASDPAALASWRELRNILDEELQRLPEKYRYPLILCGLQGKTHEQAGQELRWPKSSVSARLERASTILRERLTRRGINVPAGVLGSLLFARESTAVVPAALVPSTIRLAMGVAAGHAVAAPASVLAAQVVAGMAKIKLAVVLALSLTIGLAISGIAILAYFRVIPMGEPKPRNQSPVLAAVVELPADSRPSEQTLNSRGEPHTPVPVVSGVVEDGDGKPVAGATVILGNYRSREKPLIVQSDSGGHFAFLKLPKTIDPLYALGLIAGKQGFAPASGWATDDKDDSRNKNKVMVLAKTGTITGSVSDHEGRPIANARVTFGVVKTDGRMKAWGYPSDQLWRGTVLESFFSARTDARGQFEFRTVPVDKELCFRVVANGFAELDTAAGVRITNYLAKDGASRVNLTLAPEGRIRGQLVAHAPGTNLDGLHIWLQQLSGGGSPRPQTWTDGDGQFRFDGLPEGAFTVYMDDSPAEATWTARIAPVVTVSPRTTSKVEIELIEGVVVEGTVVDADTAQPIAKAAVGGHGPARPKTNRSEIFRVITDTKGHYRVRLPPGETEFYVQTPPAKYSTSASTSVVIPADVKEFTGPTLRITKQSE